MKTLFLIPPSKYAKNVARDLIYGSWCKGNRIAGTQFPPVSQLVVLTTLRNYGHECDLLDALALNLSINQTINIASKYKFVIVLTSTMTINEDSETLSLIKQNNPETLTIVYGSHPTFLPKYTLSKKGIDFIIQSEPEFVLRDLISSLSKNNESYKEIKGLGYKIDQEIIINEPYPFIQNLNELPIPDRTLLDKKIDYFNPIVKRTPFTTIFTSRGCSGECIYCTSPPFYGNKYRSRSANVVLEELEIISKQGYKEVFFRDESLCTDKKRVMQICEGILEKNLDLTWIASSRVDEIDEDIIKIMKKAGCHMLRFGVESGSQEILDNIQKRVTLEQTKKAFELSHKYKINTHAHCMVGMPGETEKTIDETYNFVMKINPTIITFGICSPFPGTQLYNKVRERYPEIEDGSKCNLSLLHTNAFFNHVYTQIPSKKLNKAISNIYRKIYFNPKYIMKWFCRINSFGQAKRLFIATKNLFSISFLNKS